MKGPRCHFCLFSQIKASAGLLWHCWATVTRDRPFPRAWCVSLRTELNLAVLYNRAWRVLAQRQKKLYLFIAHLKCVWPLEKPRELRLGPANEGLAVTGPLDFPQRTGSPWAVLYQWQFEHWKIHLMYRFSLPTLPAMGASPSSLRTSGTGWAGGAPLGSTPAPSLSSSISNKHEITSID